MCYSMAKESLISISGADSECENLSAYVIKVEGYVHRY